MTRFCMACAGLLAVLLLPGCANETQNNLTCPQAGFPNQDAETGCDAQQTAGTLTKVGGGSAGFDFTKLDHGGNPLPASAPAWDCVRDNVTGLVWEVKTDDNGLRDKDWTYTWYNSDPSTNDGNAGSQGSNTCGGTLPSNQCNTQAYVRAVNALSPALCGYTDWRMPTFKELRNIVHHSIDVAYPRTVFYAFWSASLNAPDTDGMFCLGGGIPKDIYYSCRKDDPDAGAWCVGFAYCNDFAVSKGNAYAVRLVRGSLAGFDFTKLDSGGNPLPASAPAWDCVRDNVTGLVWEVKTDDNGLRDKDWTYTWYNSDPSTNDGNAGSQGSNTCGGTLPSNQCNTQAYVRAVNALSPALCGYTDWRMPKVKELHNIVHHSRQNPAIDAAYFPRTVSSYYWSASMPIGFLAVIAWSVSFGHGGDGVDGKGLSDAVRLVRGGQ